jgi:integrase/recombinase XerC
MVQRRGLEVPGSARLELTAGVVHLRPEDAMVEAMLRGWRAQQLGRGLQEDSIAQREQLIRLFMAFTNEYPWQWTAAHVDEWSSWLVAERRLTPSTVRSYQGSCGCSRSS